MKNKLKEFAEIFETLFDSIKNDNVFDMIIIWSVFIGTFIFLPIFIILAVYYIIVLIPYFLICGLIGLLSFAIPLSIRGIFKIIHLFKKL